MTKIKVNTVGVDSLYGNAVRADAQCQLAVATVASVQLGMDWQIRAGSTVDERLNKVAKRLRQQEERLDKYKAILRDVDNEFLKTDRLLQMEMSSLLLRIAKKAISAGEAVIRDRNNNTELDDLLDRIVDLPKKIAENAWDVAGEGIDCLGFGEGAGFMGAVAGAWSIGEGVDKLKNGKLWGGISSTLKGVKSMVKGAMDMLDIGSLAKTGGKAAKSGAKSALPIAIFDVIFSGLDNMQEYQDGGVSAERAVGEFVLESALDIALDVGLTALLAPFVGPAAPLVATAITGVMDIASEALVGTDFTENFSDAFFDACGGVKSLVKDVNWKGLVI